MAAAKDDRLYARFDIGFDEHEKIFPLSDAAFRALVEATLYARRQRTDGFLAERMAVKRWGVEVLSELESNDAERPSLVRVDEGWQIHDFAKHQTTNADIQAKREAGAKGAAKRWHGSPIAGAIGDPMRIDGGTLAKTETETETTTSKEVVARKRASTVPLNFSITDDMRTWAAENTPMVDIDAKLPEFIDYWRGRGEVKKDWVATWRNGMRKQQEFALRDRAKYGEPERKVKKFVAHAD